MKRYYAIVNVEGRQLGGYVCAEDLATAFEAATLQYRKRYPRLYVETIAVQAMTDACNPSTSPAEQFEPSLQGALEGPHHLEERMRVQGEGRVKDLDRRSKGQS